MVRVVAWVTGASRGFGAAVAKALCAAYPQAHVVLCARGDMTATCEAVVGAGGTCDTVTADLATGAGVAAVQASMEKMDWSKYDAGVLVHNAGSLGTLALARDYVEDEAAAYMALNVTSVLALNRTFLRAVPRSPAPAVPHVVVNVSSLAAVKPFAGWQQYCAAKAARDMAMQVVGEEEDAALVKTLNYAPGPMDTDMAAVIRETDPTPAQREWFVSAHRDNKLVDVHDSAAKLCALLTGNAYASGAHIDYYDE